MSKTEAGAGSARDPDVLLADPAEQKENAHDMDPDAPPDQRLPDLPGEPEPDEPDGGGGGPAAGGQPIGATCVRRFTAVHTSGQRPESAISLIVIHSTEGPTAAGAASWWTSSQSAGSGHLIVDDVECQRALDNTAIPWGAPGANTRGFHIEHAGFAAWSEAEWLRHEQTLRRGAFKAAFHAVKFGIPLVLLDADDLRQGRNGIVTHATVTKAFPIGTHTDPGPNFPLAHFMDLVHHFAQEM